MNPGLPPPPNGKDPYLRSRLEKFYADIEEYRPGLVRTEIEERKEAKDRSSRLSRESEEDQKAKRRKRSGFDMVADPVTSMNPDGSYAGPEGEHSEWLDCLKSEITLYCSRSTGGVLTGSSSSMHAGLGTNSRHDASEDDVYQSYRKMRSDVYHQSITRVAPSPSRPERQ